MVRRTFALAALAALALAFSPALAEDAKPGTHEGKVVKVESGKLVMTGKDNKEHTHTVPATAKVTCDGKECKLEDLKAGYPIKVTVEEKEGKATITKIEAKKAE